jgi:transposase-like protein
MPSPKRGLKTSAERLARDRKALNLWRSGMPVSEIARRLKLSRATFYRRTAEERVQGRNL